MATAEQTRLTVYDLLGREIVTLMNDRLEADMHHITFDDAQLSSGVCFYRLESGNHFQTHTLTLIK